VVTDEVIDTLIPTAGFEDLPSLLFERFGQLGQGLLVSPPLDPSSDARFAEVIADLRAR